MFVRQSPGNRHASPPRPRFMTGLLTLALAGCAVGPDFVAPTAPAPDDWSSWRSGEASLRAPLAVDERLPPDWWRLFGDPVLDALQQRALAASPDLQTAALHFAQARVRRHGVAAQGWPDLGVGGSVARQRSSEYGAGTRIIDAISDDRDPLVDILSEPFTFYQAGFDASWELDLWGRVRRSVEAADADLARQAALLDLARLTVASDVARSYFELRTAQRQRALTRNDIAALDDRLKLIQSYVDHGLADHLDLARQRTELAALRARLPGLLARESASANQLALLVGRLPGELRETLAPRKNLESVASQDALPDLALGLPSEVALRRPDLRAAESRLHAATASIGVARADLYPSVRLGASFALESYLSSEFADWGSRAWSVVPAVNLPLFDGGRRRSVVQLRELEQREAAVAYQRTVLVAWQEIDDALSGYAAEQQTVRELDARVASAAEAYRLAQARYDAGAMDFIAVLDSQRAHLQARRELADSEGQLRIRFVAVNKAIGNAPPAPPEDGTAAATGR